MNKDEIEYEVEVSDSDEEFKQQLNYLNNFTDHSITKTKMNPLPSVSNNMPSAPLPNANMVPSPKSKC